MLGCGCQGQHSLGNTCAEALPAIAAGDQSCDIIIFHEEMADRSCWFAEEQSSNSACTYSFEGSWHGTKEVRGLLENFAHVDHFLMCKKPHTVHSKWLPSRVSTSCWAMLEHFPCPFRACVVSRHGSRRKVINNPKQPHFLYQKKGDCKHHNLSFAVCHRNWSMCAWGYRQ